MGSQHHSAEFLAAELKKLVGWGADPKRLPLLPNLLMVLHREHELDERVIGLVMRRALIASIDALSESIEFYGARVSAEQQRIAYRLLFKIQGIGQSVVTRRQRAIVALGVYITPDTWRRPYGAEWQFMLPLAERLPNLGQSVA